MISELTLDGYNNSLNSGRAVGNAELATKTPTGAAPTSPSIHQQHFLLDFGSDLMEVPRKLGYESLEELPFVNSHKRPVQGRVARQQEIMNGRFGR